MHPLLQADLDALPDHLRRTAEHAVEFLGGIDERPAVRPGFRLGPAELPSTGVGLDEAVRRLRAEIEPGMTASAGPRFLGFVTGGATPAALAGDWLCATYDQNGASNESVAADLERQILAWLAELLGLGDDLTGAFVTGATMANMVCLATARQWAGERLGVDVAALGLAAVGEVPVLSGTPHSCVAKSLSMLGMGRAALRTGGLRPDREAVDPAAMAATLKELRRTHPGRPVILVGNAGTVNTVDFDNLVALAELRDRFDCWLHIDAAFGGFATLTDEHRHLVEGIGLADSVSVDLHKWLNVPYDSAVQFTRRPDLQLATFANNAAYLGAVGARPDFLHLTPENSRRVRALAAWCTLVAYGREGHAEIVERDCRLARRLGRRLTEAGAAGGVELCAPVRMNVVCFRVEGDTTEFLERVAADGTTFLTPTVYQGRPAIRAAFSNWRTGEADVDRIAAAILGAV